LTDELLQTMVSQLCEMNIIQRGESGAWLLARDLRSVSLQEIYEGMKLRLPTGELCLPQRNDPIGRAAQATLDALREPLRASLQHNVAELLEAPPPAVASKELP
jgi:membrane protein